MQLFKFRKGVMPNVVLKAYDPAGAQRWRILFVSIWVVSLVAVWLLASYRAAPDLLVAQSGMRAARTELQKMRADLAMAERKLSISEKSDQVSRTANESLQGTLRAQEEELAGLRSDIAFFQRLMDGKSGRRGLSLQDLAVRAIENGRGYNLRVTLTQNLRKGEVTRGSAAIRIEGMQGERMVVLGWDSLSGKPAGTLPQFSFKYFQRLDSSFILPEGFTPNRVMISVKSEQGDNTEQTFAWSQAISQGEHDDVWQ